MSTRNSSSSDMEWDEFQKTVTTSILSNLLRLREVWTRIGIAGQVLKDRYEQTLEHYQDLSLRMYEEDVGLYDRLMVTVEGHLHTLQEYCNDLGLEVPILEEGPPLLLKHELVSRIEKLAVVRESRLNKLQELRQEEENLCCSLSMEVHNFVDERSVPTEKDLDELAQHIQMLSKEKAARQRKYQIIRSDIARVMAVLQQQPQTSLERELCTDSEDAEVLLSQDKLIAMKSLLEKLMKERDQAIALQEELTKKLAFLWDNLQENEQYQRDFLAKNNHCGRTALIALEREISRCQELRMANMGNFVNNMRQELSSLWKKCHASEDQKRTFQANMNSSIYTEDLLKLHEQEVLRWRVMYQTFESLFENVEKIGALFQRASLLQLKFNDPARLYNRGGQLLREEKERKKLLQQIPKMENELLTMAVQYEDTIGTHFTVDGLSMKDYLQSQWNLLYQEKENEKLQRKHRKEEEMSMATPRKVTRNVTPFKTPGSSIIVRGTPGTNLTPMRSRKQILKSPKPGPSTSIARSSPYPMRQINVPPTPGRGGPSMISFGYNSFEKQLNDPIRPENKRSTLNTSLKRGPKVLGSRVLPQFTNSGNKRKRISNGRANHKNPRRSRSPSKASTSHSTSVKGLTLPSAQIKFLF